MTTKTWHILTAATPKFTPWRHPLSIARIPRVPWPFAQIDVAMIFPTGSMAIPDPFLIGRPCTMQIATWRLDAAVTSFAMTTPFSDVTNLDGSSTYTPGMLQTSIEVLSFDEAAASIPDTQGNVGQEVRFTWQI